MEIKFIGTGDAFCVKNFNSNALITQNNKNLLIDAGMDLRFSLHECNNSYNDIDAVYVTHFHSDHIGGLEYLAFKSYFDPKCPKIKLYIHHSFVNTLWDNSLKAGLSMINKGELQLHNFFEVIPLETHFTWEDIHFELTPTSHVTDSVDDHPVFGLIISTNDKKVYITGDTRYTPELLMPFYEKADIIIHDVETVSMKSIIHPNFNDLQKLNTEIKRKILLWHYHDNVTKKFETWQQKARENGFKGFLKKGEILEF